MFWDYRPSKTGLFAPLCEYPCEHGVCVCTSSTAFDCIETVTNWSAIESLDRLFAVHVVWIHCNISDNSVLCVWVGTVAECMYTSQWPHCIALLAYPTVKN